MKSNPFSGDGVTAKPPIKRFRLWLRRLGPACLVITIVQYLFVERDDSRLLERETASILIFSSVGAPLDW